MTDKYCNGALLGEPRKDETRKSDANDSQPFYKILALIFIALNILIAIVILAIVYVWVHTTSERPLPQHSYCLPCNDLSLHPEDDKENFRHFKRQIENNVAVCCAEEKQHLDQLLELYVERRYRQDKAHHGFNWYGYRPCDSTSESMNKPAARLMGITDAGKTNGRVLQWDADSQQSFINPYVIYDNGRLIVNKTGYYYVYSQVTYLDERSTSGSGDLRDHGIFCHFVYRNSPNMVAGTQEKLMESTQSRCELAAPRSNSTSYVGAVFYLKESDTILVKVSNPDRVSHANSNFFGLHEI